VGDDDGARLPEDGVAGDVIEVVMRVDDEFHRQLCELLDFGKELTRGRRVLKRVDDGDAIVADDEACVGAGGAFRFRDGGEDVVAERLDGEEQGISGCILRASRAHNS